MRLEASRAYNWAASGVIPGGALAGVARCAGQRRRNPYLGP